MTATNKSKNYIKVQQFNCNSIRNKESEFREFLLKSKPDIISLNEIKCNEAEANYLLNINGYNVEYKCRNSSGGGVAILIKENINYKKINQLDGFSSEIVGVECTINNKNMSFIALYIPPKNEMDKEIFNYIELNHENYVIMGDLNAKSDTFGHLKKNKNGSILDEILLTNKCQIINENFKPTFHCIKKDAENYGSFLDFFIGSPLIANLSYDYKILKSDFDSIQALQFHSVIEIKLQLNSDSHSIDQITDKNKVKNKKYLYVITDWDKFKENLEQFTIKQDVNIEVFFDKLNIAISSAAQYNIPKVNEKVFSRPALPNSIILAIKIRNKYQRIYAKNKNLENRNKLYDQIDKVKDDIMKFKSKQWSNFIEKLGSYPTSTKAYWNRINRLRNKKQTNTIPTIIHNNIRLDNDESKAKAFGEKLAKTFTDENDPTFSEEQKNFVDEVISSKNYIKNFPNITYEQISLDELNEVINNLNNKGSLDNHKISNLMIKKLPNKFKIKLKDYLNQSINSSILPISSKESIITMIPKKGDATELKNYRPISSTSCISKLLEKIIHSRLTKYLNDKNIIIKQQSGFRKNRQTRDNLIFMSQKILETFGYRKKVCCIFFDIQSAFDKIWHNGLLFKLIKLKIPLYIIKWIENFLTDRKFKVKIGNYLTGQYNITCSTPQGTVLSPLLFSLFINDIPLYTAKNNKFSLLFADDLMYMHIFKIINNTVIQQINKQLYNLEVWLNLWRLKMAPNKCFYSIFSNNHKAGELGTKGFNNEKMDLVMYNQLIKLDNNGTFLGFRFDKFLNCKNQITHIKRSCNHRLNVMKTLSHKSWNIDIKTQLQLYKSLVRSLIDYSLFMFPILSNKNKRRLQYIQDSALRIIYKKNFEFDINTLHQWSDLETLENRAINLLRKYFDQGKMNQNPLIAELLNNFEKFEKNFKNENIMTLIDYI